MSLDRQRLPEFKLSDSELKRLIALTQAGDDSARNSLVQANLRLVASIVHRFSDRGEEKEDLFQVGVIGLIKAIDHFDLSLDVRFSTYAVPVIMGEIRQYLRSNNLLKVGRSLQDLAGKALRKKEELSSILEREPTISEVAAALEVDAAAIVDALDSARPVASLYEPTSSNEDSQYILDRIKGDDPPEETGLLDNMDLDEAMKNLTPRERLVIELRYVSGLTQSAIAPHLGVSQVHVYRIERAALDKIRQFMTAK